MSVRDYEGEADHVVQYLENTACELALALSVAVFGSCGESPFGENIASVCCKAAVPVSIVSKCFQHRVKKKKVEPRAVSSIAEMV